MKLVKIEKIESKPSRCIEVEAEDRLFAAGGEDGQSIISHNSVVQRSIIFGCILRPESWRFLGIDLKKVELSSYRAYSNVVLGIATTIEDALTVLRFASETMMKRYAELEQLGLQNFLDLPEKGQALMVMVDESGELLSPSGVKALVSSTLIPNLNNRANLGEIQIGDTLFDNYGNHAKVTNKYEPVAQTRFEMKVSSKTSGISERFIAGSEHNWVAYFTHPDGEIVGPKIVDTQYLFEFKKTQSQFPEDERITVQFKRG